MAISSTDIKNTLKKINAFNEVHYDNMLDGSSDDGIFKIKIADSNSFLKYANNNPKTSVTLVSSFEGLMNRVLTKNTPSFILESDIRSRTEFDSYLIVPANIDAKELSSLNQAINIIRTFESVFTAAISAPQAQELIKEGAFHIGLTPGGKSFDITKQTKNPAPELTMGTIAEPTFGGKEVTSPWQTNYFNK